MRAPKMAGNGMQAEIVRTHLFAKRAELLAGLSAYRETIAGNGKVPEEDQSQVAHEEFISASITALDHELLAQIEEAIARVDRGEFGSCCACGRGIPPRRLQAVPWAKYCIECQVRSDSALLPGPEAREPVRWTGLDWDNP